MKFVSAFWRGAKTLEKLFCREQSQNMKLRGFQNALIKNKISLIATLAAFLAGCATMISSSVTYTPEIRKMSYADNRLFHDMLNSIGGVGFADEALFPNAKVRTITKIDAIVPYDNRQTGVERWTVQHDGQDSCSYTVKFIPDGGGGTTFAVQKETKP
jgi:hypothetical protein